MTSVSSSSQHPQWVVIDPGHGGDGDIGSSTAYGCCKSEKDITLDIARRVRSCAPERIALTRDGDYNLSLAERTRLCRCMSPACFVSIHAGAAKELIDIWTHPCANVASARLGSRLVSELRAVTRSPSVMLDQERFSLLTPNYLNPQTAACLIEVGRLSGGEISPSLATPAYRQQIAGAIARALLQPTSFSDGVHAAPVEAAPTATSAHFDTWHEVPLVQQLTGMSCWAAAAAMLVGWRECLDIDPLDVARRAGRWQAYRDGLEPSDVAGFARAWGLIVARPAALSVPTIRELLDRYGPLWVGEASPGLHVIVVAGMYGDGSLDGTFVRIADPWPIGRGERYTLTFREFQANLSAASIISGGRPQILHTLGRRGSG